MNFNLCKILLICFIILLLLEIECSAKRERDSKGRFKKKTPKNDEKRDQNSKTDQNKGKSNDKKQQDNRQQTNNQQANRQQGENNNNNNKNKDYKIDKSGVTDDKDNNFKNSIGHVGSYEDIQRLFSKSEKNAETGQTDRQMEAEHVVPTKALNEALKALEGKNDPDSKERRKKLLRYKKNQLTMSMRFQDHLKTASFGDNSKEPTAFSNDVATKFATGDFKGAISKVIGQYKTIGNGEYDQGVSKSIDHFCKVGLISPKERDQLIKEYKPKPGPMKSSEGTGGFQLNEKDNKRQSFMKLNEFIRKNPGDAKAIGLAKAKVAEHNLDRKLIKTVIKENKEVNKSNKSVKKQPRKPAMGG